MAVIALFAAIAAWASPFIQARLHAGGGGGGGFIGTRKPVNFVGQVKRRGFQVWGGLVVMPDDGGPVRFGLRIEDVGPQALTGLGVHIVLPDVVSLDPAQCRYGVGGPADARLPGSLLDEWVELPELDSQQWLHVVCTGYVSADARGGQYEATLELTSDQGGEEVKTVTIEEPATEAESAVEGLFAVAEDERSLWAGEPEMAPGSKRLLIAQWPEFTLAHAHSFGQMPDLPRVRLSDLFYDHTLDGQVVELKGRVLERPRQYPADPGMVKESLELGAPEDEGRLICYTTRREDDLIREGSEVSVKAVLIARSRPSARESEELAMAVCPAMRVESTEPTLSRPPRSGSAAAAR